MIINYTDSAKTYVESQLIAYIGNKRRLLPLIQKAFKLLDLQPDESHCTFYDPFAGTGVVSRFARFLGFQVIANDWESYAQVMNRGFLELDEGEIDELFKDKGGLDAVLKHLNALSSPDEKDFYIAKYYCPKDTENPDTVNERLFYTQETGRKIDAIRNAIDDLYENSHSKRDRKAKNLLIALLIHEAATRANTSGVFKGFHKGFGGQGKDALGRILRPLKLSKPTLITGKYPAKVFKTCANRLTKKLNPRIRFDLAYIDPPYNQHQYGSNYHLLNTVALNDRPPVNEAIYINSKKVDKSAIRKDWVKTKSSYCYRNEAFEDFKDLIDHMNAHYIMVSYSTDGIIPFDDMLKTLSQKGKLTIVTSEYTKYRGGKQALTTEKSNIEFLLVVDTESPAKPADVLQVKECLIDQKIALCLKKCVDMVNLSLMGYTFYRLDGSIKTCIKDYKDWTVGISIDDDHRFAEIKGIYKSRRKNFSSIQWNRSWDGLPFRVKESLVEDLQIIVSVRKDREIEILLSLIEKRIYLSYREPSDDQEKMIMSYYAKIPYLLKKFNNRKAYVQSLKTIQKILDTLSLIRSHLPALYYSPSFYKRLIQVKRIVDEKIHHRPDGEYTEVTTLKSSLMEQYDNTLGAA